MAQKTMQDDARKWVAELIGTFFLTFAGVSAIVLTAANPTAFAFIGLLLVALSHGAALGLAVYAFGPVSGAQVNPAISMSLFVGRKLPAKDLVIFIVFQIIGAALAAALARGLYPGAAVTDTNDGGTLGVLTTVGSPQFNVGAAFVLEAIMTFFLACAVWSVVKGGEPMTSASGLVIGGTLALCILWGGYWTGASLNPARSMGPAIAYGTGIWDTIWLYWLAPLLGGALAGLIFPWLRPEKMTEEQMKGRHERKLRPRTKEKQEQAKP